jgi:MoxR-like ATPase
MKKFNVSGVSYEKKLDIVDQLINNMISKTDGAQSGYMLGGDVGVGKTSFIKDFARLVGMDLIVIETPHLVEEHIIDIPFVVFDSATDQEHKMDVKADSSKKDFKVELATSKLYSELTKAKKQTDAQYLKNVYKADESTVKTFEELGGSEKEIPDDLKKVRAQYDCILFLDEYFRQTSNSIRNMLRSILNGRIGQNELPKNVYVVFASNLQDDGVGEILSNEDFRLIQFDGPSKEEWFGYLVTKFAKDEKVKLKDEVINKFYDIIEEEHLAHDDLEADVRTSPRRWEQLLLYINSSLPVKDEDEAKQLLTNVQHNFREYETGAKSKLASGVMNAVVELIKETSNIEVSTGHVAEPKDWRDALEHQIQQKIKLGKHRKYIPVISGAPGVGKTKHVTDLCIKLNLVPVYIDVHNLSAEDVIGIPVPGNDGGLSVKFSVPALAKDIENQIKKGTKNFKERVKQEFDNVEASKKIKEFDAAPFKYLLFFDEMNRTSTKVFNAIRRVMLEKDFGDGTSIPEESIVIAAINPISNGTVKLTKHMKDVLDIIPAGVSWTGFKRHIQTVETFKGKEHAEVVFNVFEHFVDRFRVKHSPSNEIDPHFYLNVGSTPTYVSPRECTDLLLNTVNYFETIYNRLEKKIEKMDVPDYALMEADLRKALYKQFSHTLDYVIKVKNGSIAPEFDETLKEWFDHGEIGIEGSFKKTVKSKVSLENIIDSAFDDMDANLHEDMEFINYIETTEPQKFKEDLTEFLVNKIGEDLINGVEVITKKSHKKKSVDAKAEEIKLEEGEVSKLEFAVREIVHAIKIHKLSNVMVEMVHMAVSSMMGQMADKADAKYGDTSDESSEITSVVAGFNSLVRKYIKSLNA